MVKGVSMDKLNKKMDKYKNEELSSVEGIPNRIKDYYEGRYTNYVTTEDGQPVYKNGIKVTKLNKKGLNERLKEWANKMAKGGVNVNEIDFDQYKLDPGLKLDKAPSNCLIILEIGSRSGNYSDFYTLDKRSENSSGNRFWEDSYLTRLRDNRYVNIEKIPISQLLDQAKTTWVLPETELISDPREIRKERAKRYNKESDRFARYKNWKELNRWGEPDNNAYLDKSGYYINRRAIAEKYAKMKDKLEKDGLGSDLAKSLEALSLSTIDTFNKLASDSLDLVMKYYKEKGKFTYEISEIPRLIREAKAEIDELQVDIGDYLEMENSSDWYKDRAKKYLLALKNFFNSERDSSHSSGFKLKTYYEEGLKQLGSESNSSTEGIRGQCSNRSLSAYESYVVPKEILAKLEED